jgi:hypothetical protein
MRERLLAVFVVLLVGTVGVVAAAEARRNLNGDYAVTSARSCSVTNSPNQFTADAASGALTVIPAGGVFRQNVADTGIITFNLNGTGTNVGVSRIMNISAAGGSIFSVSRFSVPFTYTIDDDNTVDISFDEGTFTTVNGNGKGNTGRVGPRSARLRIGKGGNVLVSAGGEGIQPETVEIDVLNDGTITQYRLCTRSSTMVRH